MEFSVSFWIFEFHRMNIFDVKASLSPIYSVDNLIFDLRGIFHFSFCFADFD